MSSQKCNRNPPPTAASRLQAIDPGESARHWELHMTPDAPASNSDPVMARTMASLSNCQNVSPPDYQTHLDILDSDSLPRGLYFFLEVATIVAPPLRQVVANRVRPRPRQRPQAIACPAAGHAASDGIDSARGVCG